MSGPIVAYGEILWDLLPSGAVLGGAPFNFVYRINSLGYRGVMVSRLGSDELGERALGRVQQLGLPTRYIQRDPKQPTGTVEVRFDEQNEPQYRIIPEVAYDKIEMTDDLRQLVSEAECICFGTLIQRSERSRVTLHRLLESFNGRFALLDINLRRDCFTRRSVQESIEAADILKLNEEEAKIVAGFHGMEPGRFEEDPAGFTESLFASSKLGFIVVTMGERGVFAASREGQRVYHPAFSVQVRDTVGAGDAFTAAFLDALLNGADLPRACRVASAAGALVATQEGATQPLNRSRIETFLEDAVFAAVPDEMRVYCHLT